MTTFFEIWAADVRRRAKPASAAYRLAVMAEPPRLDGGARFELLRIPSVSADPELVDEVVRAAEWVRELHPRRGRGGRAGGDREASARGRRVPRVRRSRRRADGHRVRALRRSAARAARALGVSAVRADCPRRLALRARSRRRQGPALHPPQGRRAARGRGRSARERALHVRRRGGVGRPFDHRLPRGGRARGRRLRDLRREHARARQARVLRRDARDRVLPRSGADRREGPALRRLRRRGAEREPRAPAGARRRPAAGRERAGAAARRDRQAERRGDRELERSRAGLPRRSPRRALARPIRARPRTSTCARASSRRSTSTASWAASPSSRRP